MRKRHPSRFRRGGMRIIRRTKRRVVSKSFDPSHLVRKGAPATPVHVVEIDHEFSDFNVSDVLKKNIAYKGLYHT